MVWGELRSVAYAFAFVFAFTTGASAQGAKVFSGTASFYNQPGKTASGSRYNPQKMTCAHRTLPFGTRLLVTDKKTKRSVTVTVNDRGPFIRGRVLDLSLAAARALGMVTKGLTEVNAKIEYQPAVSIKYRRT